MYNKNILSRIWLDIKNAYSEIRTLDISAIKLEEIDIIKKIVVVRSRGARVVLKLSIAEAIADPSIVANLVPVQACWLGYYAGLSYDINEIQKQKQHLKNADSSFSLKCNKGQYRVLSQDRKGEITYIDTTTQMINSNHPINIVQDKHIVSCFDASQACYIGILAGIYAAKWEENKQPKRNQQPILRVIK